MTAHELAKELLEYPEDTPVCIEVSGRDMGYVRSVLAIEDSSYISGAKQYVLYVSPYKK